MDEKICGINIRVSEKEKEKIASNAEKCSLKISEYLRKAGLKEPAYAFPQKEVYEVYRRLRLLQRDIKNLTEDEIMSELVKATDKILYVYTGQLEEKPDGSNEDLAH